MTPAPPPSPALSADAPPQGALLQSPLQPGWPHTVQLAMDLGLLGVPGPAPAISMAWLQR